MLAANCETEPATSPADIAAIAMNVSGTSGSQGVVVVTASSVEADGGTASWTHMGTGTALFGDGVAVEYRVTAVNVPGRAENSSNTAEGKTKETADPGVPMHIKLVGVDDSGNIVYLYWSKPAGLTGTSMLHVQRQVYSPGYGDGLPRRGQTLLLPTTT